MRCMTCGAEMVLISTVPDDTMPVAGFEHQTFMCSGCREVERRLTFRKRDSNASAKPMPVHMSPPIVPTPSGQAGSIVNSGLFRQMIARLRRR